MKALVTFYSRNGHTRKVAETLAQELKADFEEIIDLKKRRGFWGFLYAGRDAMRKCLTDIKPIEKDPAAYALVIIGTPIWAGNLVPAPRIYLRQNKDKIKNVAFFCTFGGAGGDKRAFEEMAKESGLKPLATMAVRQEEVDKNLSTDKISGFAGILLARF